MYTCAAGLSWVQLSSGDRRRLVCKAGHGIQMACMRVYSAVRSGAAVVVMVQSSSFFWQYFIDSVIELSQVMDSHILESRLLSCLPPTQQTHLTASVLPPRNGSCLARRAQGSHPGDHLCPARPGLWICNRQIPPLLQRERRKLGHKTRNPYPATM